MKNRFSNIKTLEELQALISLTEDINACSIGETSLLYEFLKTPENTKFLELLIKSGADVSQHTKNWSEDNEAPLMLACKNLYIDSIKILLEAGANINARDNNGETALFILTKNLVYRKAKLHRNIKINSIEDERKITTLIELLLEHDADPKIKNAHNDSPLTLVTEHMELFKEFNAYYTDGHYYGKGDFRPQLKEIFENAVEAKKERDFIKLQSMTDEKVFSF